MTEDLYVNLPSDQPHVDPDIINDIEKIAQVDKQNVLGSIQALSDQLRQAWADTQKIKIDLQKEIQHVVVAGMGGSGLGASVVKHLFKPELKIPLEIANSYTLPGYVGKNSLVILSSYSGNTEEVIACAKQAETLKAQIIVISGGGKLAKIAKSNKYPAYIIDPKYNPSQQPRMAVGYAIVGLIGLLNQAGILSVSQPEIEQAAETIIHTQHDCRVEAETENNPAKTLAFNLIDRRPNLVGAEFLTGALHVVRNQFHENAKTFAEYHQVPEINHHLMESLQLPHSNVLDNIFLFFNSDLYHQRNQKRMELTQQAVEKQDIQTLAVDMESADKMTQVFELITLMAYTNFYLAIMHQIDPSQIEMVDWFKQELG